MCYRENIPPTPALPRTGGREILDLVECRAGGGFSLAGATKYFSHERLKGKSKFRAREAKLSHMEFLSDYRQDDFGMASAL